MVTAHRVVHMRLVQVSTIRVMIASCTAEELTLATLRALAFATFCTMSFLLAGQQIVTI